MFKRAVLTILFFILTISILGSLTSKAYAQAGASCTTTGGWTGTCRLKKDCPAGTAGIAWDNTVSPCNSLTGYGCCGAENKICDFVSDATKKAACKTCMGNGTGVWTALGCIHTDPSAFIGEILRIGIGIGGGIAFLLILLGGFQILTSAGNPEKLNAGKELVTSAVTGLLIIIFSIFILRLIGVNIFAIPEFK